MTPVFCCGFECGVTTGETAHWLIGAGSSFDTTIKRSGATSLRINVTNTFSSNTNTIASGTMHVGRVYIYFASLPTTDAGLALVDTIGNNVYGAVFKLSDSKIYAGDASSVPGITFGATGVSVTTGTWYRIDYKVDVHTNPHTIDVSVDGVACGQRTRALAASTFDRNRLSVLSDSTTADVYFDDFLLSNTEADYPIGAGYINHFVPTADGAHNVAGANDFERSATGTDITNATTTAFQLIDDVPLKSGVPTEYINLIAPPNATDYVEVVFGPAPGISTPTVAPRAVDVICAYACSATGTNNLRLALNDNGTTDDVFNGNAALTNTSCKYARKHYADPPSAATVWTLSGNGNFNNARLRCLTSDAAPDPFLASAMIEAEFIEGKFDYEPIQQPYFGKTLVSPSGQTNDAKIT